MSELDLSPDLRTAVLELGLEGQIQLPEVTPTAAERVGAENAIVRLREVMEGLVRDGRIRVYRGQWNDDHPAVITPEEAQTLLADPKWYEFRTADQDEERLHYVNVDNLLDP